MITAEFYKDKARLTGFRISGHSGLAAAGSDVCCAAVSSAAELVCNTLTDFFEGEAVARAAEDGCAGSGGNALECRLISGSGEAYRLIEAFCTHLRFIEEEYPRGIKVIVK